jgi:hypothetical protein
MFDVGSGVTLILDNNITLRGSREADSTLGNHNTLVGVSSGGTLVMNDGAAITGNVNNMGSGGGVYVSAGGTFIMNGGTISGNMSILGKTAIKSAIDGAIIGKAGASALLGLASDKLPNHTMLSKGLGQAADNVAKSEINPSYPACLGGGVYVSGGRGIFGKSTPAGIFIKNGGTITGYGSDPVNGNSVYDCDVHIEGDGQGGVRQVQVRHTLSASGGHAVYFDAFSSSGKQPISVDTTLGPYDNFEFMGGIYTSKHTEKPKAASPQPVVYEGLPDEDSLVVSDDEAVAEDPIAAGFAEIEPEPAPVPVLPPPVAVAPLQEAPAVAPTPVPEAAVPAPPAMRPRNRKPQGGPPGIAAYAFGAKSAAVNRALATRLLVALAGSGRYQAVEEYKDFFDRAEAELKDSAIAASSERLMDIGRDFGAEYVCVAEIAPVFGERRVFAYILDAETGEVAAKGTADAPLRTLPDMTVASGLIVEAMFKKEAPASAPPAAPQLPPLQLSGTAALCPQCQCQESACGEAGAEPAQRKSKGGFTLGYGLSGAASMFSIGSALVRPITEKTVSLVMEANIWFGGWNSTYDYYGGSSVYISRDVRTSFSGVDVPVLFRFEKSVFSSEAGAFIDILSGTNDYTHDKEWLLNAGVAIGGGLTFGKGYTQYFYRFNYGTAYYTNLIGIRQLF